MKNGIPTSEQFLSAYEELSDPLFRHVYFRIGDRERSIDLVQETFSKAWSYINRGKEVDNLKAFLYSIAHNMIVDEYRKPNRISLDVLVDDEQFDVSDPRESEKTLHQSELRLVVDGIQSLSPKYREAITMRYLEGLLPHEIAQALGVSENVVSVRINRAVHKLKQMLRYDE